MEYSGEDIFLNKNLIITHNHFKTAVLIKSPLAKHDNEGIWFPTKMIDFNRSKNNKYMCVSIKYKIIYKIYRYKGFNICEAKEIIGTKLIDCYKEMKKNNTARFNENIENDYKEKSTNDLIKNCPGFRNWYEEQNN